ncbi:hypothetical protein DVH24_016147 [Malus domestica]|uniref:Uncharacterized protein n=1 Tax=Malus domestica TaxID=3750 RepID=A0A498JEX7_MALDO|nr:hypothetical protein DVH24_016147 [Malus domestica]
MVLQLLLTVAFSAVPLTLYVPPVRSLNPFVETMEELLSESRTHTNRILISVEQEVALGVMASAFAHERWAHS